MLNTTPRGVVLQVGRCAGFVWEQLGAGHDEAIYRNAMVVALQALHLHPRQEVCVPVMLDGICVGTGRADLVVGEVVVELKTVAKLNAAHRAQLRAYLRGGAGTRGLLINFPPVGGDRETEEIFHKVAT